MAADNRCARKVKILLDVSRSSQNGVALAVLLWMIAGMSLLVSAVVSYARTETAMAELKMKEVRLDALAAGAIRLAALDMVSMSEESEGVQMSVSAGPESLPPSQLFAGSYELDEVRLSVRILPPEDFFSIVSGTPEGLHSLLVSQGGLDSGAATTVAENFIGYRSMQAMRYREQLLSVAGITKDVYDLIAPYVSPIPSAGSNGYTSVANAGGQLAEDHSAPAMLEETDNGEAKMTEGGVDCEQLSFACLDQQRAQLAGAHTNWLVSKVEATFPDGSVLEQTAVFDPVTLKIHRQYRPTSTVMGAESL